MHYLKKFLYIPWFHAKMCVYMCDAIKFPFMVASLGVYVEVCGFERVETAVCGVIVMCEMCVVCVA